LYSRTQASAWAASTEAKTPADEELGPQRLVETLELARGGRRAGRREQVADAVLPAYAVEEHLAGAGAEAPGEDLAVVGEDLIGHPMRAHGQG
jgi:hypothetical protein